MSNDGANDARITALENQVAEQSKVISELRAEHAATQAILAAMSAKLDAHERLLGELVEFKAECLARFARIEATLAQTATKEDVARALNRGLLVMITVQCALNGALYALLR